MTVLTSLPSKDAKESSDKVPLVDGSVNASSPSPPPPQQPQPQPQSQPQPYDPRALEAGEHNKKVEPNMETFNFEEFPAMKLSTYLYQVLATCAFLCVFVAFFLFLAGPGCRAFNKYIERDPEHWGNKYRVPYNLHAEKDTIKPTTPSAADCFNVYKELEKSVFDEGSVIVSGLDHQATDHDAPAAAAIADDYVDDGKPQPVNVTKTARFIHDFSVNITGIVDVAAHKCYIMPLVHDPRSPVSLSEVMFKMTRSSFEIEMRNVLSTMLMVKPELNDLSKFGQYIIKDCADYPTYRLEKAVLTGVQMP